MTMRPKQLARLGEFHLEEAVLDVLLEARHNGQCIGAAEIGRRAGIFRDSGNEGLMHDAIVSGILIKLRMWKKVVRCEQPKGRRGWWIADEEFVRRRDDFEIG